MSGPRSDDAGLGDDQSSGQRSGGQHSGESPAGSPNPFSALRHPAFARFALGTTLCGVAQFLGGLATPFLINQLTDSNSWVGAASFAALVPAVIGTPLAGTLADRMDRRILLLAGLSLQILSMVAVAVSYTHLTLPTTPYV